MESLISVIVKVKPTESNGKSSSLLKVSTSADDQKMKALFKEAIVKVMSENQELVSSLLVDALEDIGYLVLSRKEKKPNLSAEKKCLKY